MDNVPFEGRHRKPRGPYGTNEGDIWLSPGSPIQNQLDADGEGLKLVTEVLAKDGDVQECVYVTKSPEIIERAREGTELYVAQQASQN